MGSSGEDPNKGIDASVGGLVWVRRRNGSWWPGKILGPDELPEGCVPTPRSGTPVKLLGREDASVDWYNLEKSKRVKAFHCGEYEDCIKKVKASASHPSKKAVKYARRDDAILQALKLESARIVNNDHQDISSATPDAQDGEQNHDMSPSAEESEDADADSITSEDDDSDSVSQSAISFEERDRADPAKEESKPHDSEEDGAGGAKKRMRGLEDLGMGATSLLKRKRSQVGHVQELSKRKNRRRTLTKVLECTAMVSVPVDQSSGLESHESEKDNDNQSDRKEVLQCENGVLFNPSADSDDKSEQKDSESCQKLFDVPLVDEEKDSAGFSPVLSGASHQTQVGGESPQSTQSSRFKTLSFEGQHESGSTSLGTANTHLIEKGASEWRLKGKRNSRSRKVDPDDEAEGTGTDHRDVKSRPIAEIGLADLRGWRWNNNKREESHARVDPMTPQRLLPYRQSRFTVNPKYDSSDFSLGPRHAAVGSGLYDVEVGVKSAHPPQRVPYISLMSKFTGRPIIGHPLAVEAVRDGFCDGLIAKAKSSSLEAGRDEESIHRRRRAQGRGPGRPPTSHRRSRRNGLHSKKVRKLSSLTGSHRLSREEKKPMVEKLKGPSIACVPLKVVFSRINAALSASVRPGPRPVATDGI